MVEEDFLAVHGLKHAWAEKWFVQDLAVDQILARTFSDPSRICLRAQPLESSLGRVPQAADGACKKI